MSWYHIWANAFFFNEKFIIIIITTTIFSQLGLQKKFIVLCLGFNHLVVRMQLFVICHFRVYMFFLVVFLVCLYVTLLIITLTYLLGRVLKCQLLLFNLWVKGNLWLWTALLCGVKYVHVVCSVVHVVFTYIYARWCIWDG